MGHLKDLDSESVINSNHKILASSVSSTLEQAQTKVVHHYHKSFRGFSAMLSPKEADKLRNHDSVVSVFESPMYKLHTERSYDFLLEQVENQHYKGIFEKHRNNPANDVVIGHLDSGIWPEAQSFNGDRFRPYPRSFWGDCYHYEYNQLVGDILCNNKIIGSRFYYWGYEHTVGNFNGTYHSARDDYGHGTHTISTAAGVDVQISDNQENPTVIKGAAPWSRIASYKVCWHDYCDGSDILRGYDDAISDGVDLITISLGPPISTMSSYFEDPFALGSYHAFSQGILTVASAGNEGHLGHYSVVNVAPWVLTVAATSTDRDLSSDVVLGNGVVLKGHGHNSYDFKDKQVVWANDKIKTLSDCSEDDLDKKHIEGKIVVCRLAIGIGAVQNVQNSNGVGVIFVDNMEAGRMVFYEPIPYSIITPRDFQILQKYLDSNQGKATLSILRTKVKIHTKPSPKMAYFSSRGPSRLNPDIIKPDIAAPGMSILAAFPSSLPLDSDPNPKPIISGDQKQHSYMSGTSMACPHVSGVAAVLKSYYKNWSPAWIKSALMTTATWNDNTNHTIKSIISPANPFDMGSGLIVPGRIFNPGLVYDMSLDDINGFICNQAAIYGIDRTTVKNLFGIIRCNNIPPYNLNYPSIGGYNLRGVYRVRRRLTLATFEGPLVYKAVIDMPESVRVRVYPNVLDFTKFRVWEYYVSFENVNAKSSVYGSITWVDGYGHDVKTPIALVI
ncbi:subtilisin-like serine-protease S [Euphorbia lathyris]|uniref:subtilisin-like serine-protease S n=1 Tax=Euphorbia lathyris TaxID=212925 RepID=UPI0033140B89